VTDFYVVWDVWCFYLPAFSFIHNFSSVSIAMNRRDEEFVHMTTGFFFGISNMKMLRELPSSFGQMMVRKR